MVNNEKNIKAEALDQAKEYDSFLDRMLDQAKEYDSFLDRIGSGEISELDAGQIKYLLNGCMPPLGANRSDYMRVLRTVADSAARTGDAELLKRVYLSVPFYRGHALNAEKERLILDGAETFRSSGRNTEAAELYIRLAWAAEDGGKRDGYVKEALGLPAAPEVRAYAQASELFFGEEDKVYPKKPLNYIAFAQQIKLTDGELILLPVEYCGFGSDGVNAPDSIGAPLLKGRHHMGPYPESLEKGADVRVFPLSGAAVKVKDADFAAEAICESGKGVVRFAGTYADEKFCFELAGHSVRGDGLMPLCVGNEWMYKDVSRPGFTVSLFRKVVFADAENAILACVDFTLENGAAD